MIPDPADVEAVADAISIDFLKRLTIEQRNYYKWQAEAAIAALIERGWVKQEKSNV